MTTQTRRPRSGRIFFRSLLGLGLGAALRAARGLRRLLLLLGLAVVVGVAVLDRRQARLQRGHQVRHPSGLLGLGLDGDLLAGGLALDQLEHLVAVLVLVA